MEKGNAQPPSRLLAYGIVNRRLSTKEQWVTFWALFCFCTVTMYNSIKATPALTQIGAVFGFSLADAGFIVSAFAISGLIFAYPGAFIMRTFGVKSSLLAAGFISLAGTCMGLFVQSPEAFLVSRALEGCACGLASVIVPNVIPRIFPLKKMGLVMGVWSLWVTPGLVLGFLTTPTLFSLFGYQSLWILSIALELITLLWMLFCVKLPATPENVSTKSPSTKDERPAHPPIASAIAIALSMTCWGVVYGAVNTFYPTYLQEVKGLSSFTASTVPLVLALITAPFGIIFGIISGKTHTRKWFLAIPYAIIAVLFATIGFSEDSGLVGVWLFAIVLGICAGGIPMSTYALVPILAQDPKKTDYVMATLGFCLQLANLSMGIYGGIIAAIGYYHAALFVLVPFAVLGCLLALLSVGDRKALANSNRIPQK